MERMMDLTYLIRDLIENRNNFQNWLNNRYKSEENVIIPKKALIRLLSEAGIHFESFNFGEIVDTLSYNIDQVLPEDIVLDIGANIGAFSIQVAKHNNRVYAVEPLFTCELEKNIRLSHATVTVIPSALGDGSYIKIDFQGRSRSIKTMTLTEIKQLTGGCDFLKIDCEGGEWFIHPEELNGIRHIEAELHYFPGMKDRYGLMDYIKENFNYSLFTFELGRNVLLHAERK